MIQYAFNKLSTFFTFSTMLDDLFKRTEHLVQQSVEYMLKQMLKPLTRTLICHRNRKDVVTLGNILRVSGIHPSVTFHEKLQQLYAKVVVADCYVVLMQFPSVSFCWKRQSNYFEQSLKSLFKWRKWLILFMIMFQESIGLLHVMNYR